MAKPAETPATPQAAAPAEEAEAAETQVPAVARLRTFAQRIRFGLSNSEIEVMATELDSIAEELEGN